MTSAIETAVAALTSPSSTGRRRPTCSARCAGEIKRRLPANVYNRGSEQERLAAAPGRSPQGPEGALVVFERSEVRFGQSVISYADRAETKAEDRRHWCRYPRGRRACACAGRHVHRQARSRRSSQSALDPSNASAAPRDLPPPPSARELRQRRDLPLSSGRQARLRVEPGGEGGKVRLASGRLGLPVAPDLSGRQRAAAVRKKLVTWYRAHAAARLPERVEPWRARPGAPAGRRRPHPQPGEALGVLRRLRGAPLQLADCPGARLPHRLRGRPRARPPREHRHHTPSSGPRWDGCSPTAEERREALRRLGERLVW